MDLIISHDENSKRTTLEFRGLSESELPKAIDRAFERLHGQQDRTLVLGKLEECSFAEPDLRFRRMEPFDPAKSFWETVWRMLRENQLPRHLFKIRRNDTNGRDRCWRILFSPHLVLDHVNGYRAARNEIRLEKLDLAFELAKQDYWINPAKGQYIRERFGDKAFDCWAVQFGQDAEAVKLLTHDPETDIRLPHMQTISVPKFSMFLANEGAHNFNGDQKELNRITAQLRKLPNFGSLRFADLRKVKSKHLKLAPRDQVLLEKI
jgi:hypothetical protein